MRLAAADQPSKAWAVVHLMAIVITLLPGLLVFGWRAAIVLLLVMVGGFGAMALLRSSGWRGSKFDPVHLLWSTLIAGLLLPAEWGTFKGFLFAWPATIGLLIALLLWTRAGTGSPSATPALLVTVAILLLAGDLVAERGVLHRSIVVAGDVLDAESVDRTKPAPPWLTRQDSHTDADARSAFPTSVLLNRYVATDSTIVGSMTVRDFISEQLPPPENLVLLGDARPIGMASVAATIAAGLVLCFRGVVDASLVLLTFAAGYVALLVSPIPVVTGGETVWTWLPGFGGAAGPESVELRWRIGITFVHYELLSGPLIFIALLIAPLASLRPLARRWRVPYGIVTGVGVVTVQRYIEPTVLPLFVPVLLGFASPWLDRISSARIL